MKYMKTLSVQDIFNNIHSPSSTGPASSELKQHHKLINANNPLIMEKISYKHDQLLYKQTLMSL